MKDNKPIIEQLLESEGYVAFDENKHNKFHFNLCRLVKDIKLWGIRDWLYYCAPKPLSYIGDLWNCIRPKYKYNWYDNLKCTLKPRQRWIKKHIEYKQWCDKTELIPKFLFGCVVHFVEDEKAFEVTDWVGSSERHAKFAVELHECYHYIKVTRPNLEKRLDDAYNHVPLTGSFEEAYADVLSIEKDIEDSENKYVMWIAENKGYMWT